MSFESLLAEGRIAQDVPLDHLTTYKRGGPAAYYDEVDTHEGLRELAPVDVPVLVVGKGSNLVVADDGFPGLVIKLTAQFTELDIGPEVVVAGASVGLPVLARAASKAGRGGLEWMVGVPGTVGGAVRMNAGCFGHDTAESLVTASIVDVTNGHEREVGPDDLAMAYRHTNLADADVVVQATFATTPVEVAAAEAEMRAITRWRKEHQPGGTFNAGSVFKNPPDDAAGRVIDSLGLKGTAVGGASVSTKHANFFVADGSASAQDIYDLMRLVQRRVLEETGLALIPEIRFVGFDR